MEKKLTAKQKAWIDYYLQTGNATEAARLAGYKHPNKQGPENLVKLGKYLEAEIEQKDNERIASSEEVLEFFTKVMRGEEKEEKAMKVSDSEGNEEVIKYKIAAKMEARNKAAEMLGKRYRLFVDKVEVESVTAVEVIDD